MGGPIPARISCRLWVDKEALATSTSRATRAERLRPVACVLCPASGRAYWLSLQGGEHGEVSNKKTVTVHVPVDKVLDVEMLQTLMERSREGKI